MSNELLTEFEKKRFMREKMVIEKYNKIREQYPNVSNNRIYKAMEKDTSYSMQWIRLILIRHGVVKTRPRSGRTKSERV